MSRRQLGVALGIGLVLAAVAIATLAAVAAAGKGTGGDGNRASLRRLQGVNFIGNCRFSHRAPDDPIVSPGLPGASHDHSFVGNRTTSAFSTLDTLLTAGTSCRRAGETAAYWIPTLFVDGSPVTPEGATIYYRRRTLMKVTAPPAGFKLIAGDGMATTAQPLRVTFWNCGQAALIPPSSTPPACPSGRGSGLRLHVTFPACWNGSSLDSPNHKQHVAYAMRGRCPAGYPVALPQISLIYRYAVQGAHDFALASGGVFSAHADFFNAWNEDTLEDLVASCLNRLRRCGRGS